MIIDKRLQRLFKIVISVGLSAALVAMIDWDVARAELSNLPFLYTGFAVAIFALQFVISAWKWRASLAAHDVSIPFGFLVRTYCTGAFFSSFLPSNVGGDIYRTYKTSAYCSVPLAMFAVILERLLGLLALVVVGFVGLLWFLWSSGTIPVTAFAAFAGCVTIAYFIMPILCIRVLQKSAGWRNRVPAKLKGIASIIDILHSNSGKVLRLLCVCLLFQVIATFAVALLFAGIAGSWYIAESAVANAAGSIAAILPISINGFGITEASFAGVASQLGVDFTVATLVSFLVRILVLPLVLAFGLMYMFEDKVSPQKVAASLDAETV